MNSSLKHQETTSLKRKAFTLVELLVVIAVVMVLLGILVPAVSSIGSTTLKTAGREVANQFTTARSEAISKYKIHGVGLVTDDPNDPSSNYRSSVILKQNASTGSWSTASSRITLPLNICFEPAAPAAAYTDTASYAVSDPSVKESEYLLDSTDLLKTIDGVTYQVFSYRPNGTAVNKPDLFLKQHLILVETANPDDAGSAPLVYSSPNSDTSIATPSNWVHLSVDILTGRTRLYQP